LIGQEYSGLFAKIFRKKDMGNETTKPRGKEHFGKSGFILFCSCPGGCVSTGIN